MLRMHDACWINCFATIWLAKHLALLSICADHQLAVVQAHSLPELSCNAPTVARQHLNYNLPGSLATRHLPTGPDSDVCQRTQAAQGQPPGRAHSIRPHHRQRHVWSPFRPPEVTALSVHLPSG